MFLPLKGWNMIQDSVAKITLLSNRRKHLLGMYEPRVVLVLVQFGLESCPTSPHEDHQDWLCGYACQNERSAIDMRHES